MQLPKELGFPGVSVDKESACNIGDVGSIPGLGRSPGEENGNTHPTPPPAPYSRLKNPMDRGARQGCIPWGRQESDTTEHNVLKDLDMT